MKDKKKFKEFMAGLGLLFDKEIQPKLSSVYWQTLEPFSDEQCEKVFNLMILTCKFFPKPVDFLDILQGRSEDKALIAWLKVNKTVKDYGQYQSVKFGDPVIHSVIDSLGGWGVFQDCDMKEWVWREKEFITRYKAMERKTDHPEYLPGVIEIENNARGYTGHTEVVLIEGEERKLLED